MNQKQLYPLSLSRLQATEVGQLVSRTMSEIKDQKLHTLNDDLIQKLFQDLDVALPLVQENGRSQTKMVEMESVEELDQLAGCRCAGTL